MFVVSEIEPQMNEHLLKISLRKYDKLINSFSKRNILLNREFYKLLNAIKWYIYALKVRKVFLNEFWF